MMDKIQPQTEPLVELDYQGVHVTVLGTAHVSKASADMVRTLLESGAYDSVAVELCQSRHKPGAGLDRHRHRPRPGPTPGDPAAPSTDP